MKTEYLAVITCRVFVAMEHMFAFWVMLGSEILGLFKGNFFKNHVSALNFFNTFCHLPLYINNHMNVKKKVFGSYVFMYLAILISEITW